MAYNLDLAARIRARLAREQGLDEKKMFGGVCYLLNGNMACGVHQNSLIVRVGTDKHTRVLTQLGVRPFDLTGKSMSGWVMVDPAGYESDARLDEWVRMGTEFARSLPPKGSK